MIAMKIWIVPEMHIVVMVLGIINDVSVILEGVHVIATIIIFILSLWPFGFSLAGGCRGSNDVNLLVLIHRWDLSDIILAFNTFLCLF